jgi:monoamine oxidase
MKGKNTWTWLNRNMIMSVHVNNNMKVGIIGGGISGLFLGYKLTLLGHTVCVFESSDRLGGRVHTIHMKDGNTFEAGAGRFNTSHKRLFKLLSELKLDDKVMPINTKKTYKINSRDYNYDKYVGGLLFNKVVTASKVCRQEDLKSITLRDYMTSVIGASNTKRVIDAFGYNSEFELQNAYTSLEIFKTDFNDVIQYYYLKGGLSQVINELERKIIEKKSNRIMLQSEVYDYDVNNNIVHYKQNAKLRVRQEKFDKVVFCVTKQALLKFTSLLQHDRKLLHYLTHSIEMAPLHRIFVKFPVEDGKDAWFKGLNRTTTNLPIRYVIPMNAQAGLMQISYTDKQHADYWNSFESEQEVVKELMNNLRVLYPKLKIPSPMWIKRYYWKEGATYWRPNFNIYRNSNRIVDNYYIAGEITSKFHNAWIEGALESVTSVVWDTKRLKS